MSATTTPTTNVPSSDFLIRGSDYLAQRPDFQLIGRDEELVSVANVLMRKDNNNLIVHGANGVGLSSILLGLQASKKDDKTPFDIVGKRFYYLDIDALFESGDTAKIIEGFQKSMATLKSQPDTVLIVEDVKDFLDGVRDNGVKNIINMLMREARTNNDLQVIFETRDNSIGELLNAHSDIRDSFTIVQINEPSPQHLQEIVKAGIPGLEAFHGVKVPEETVKMVLDLTVKYPGLTLNTAQPKRTTMILEGALTAYRHQMHSNPAMVALAESELAEVVQAEEGRGGPLADKSANELAALKIEREAALAEVQQSWSETQAELRKLYEDQRRGEQRIREIDADIEVERKKAEEAVQKAQSEADAAETAAEVTPAPAAAEGETAARPSFGRVAAFSQRLQKSGIENTEVVSLKDQRAQMVALVKESRDKYKAMAAEINAGLELKPEHVLAEFSRLSGVPMNKLQQDETAKLMKLEETLGSRVFGQEEPVKEVAKSVRRGRAGLKKANKPIGSFMFLGPSGVGKTELAKALAEALFGDERALQVYDMSEYMEKHASAKLIGSPPGYEGYEAGGILTNNMRRQPYCVNVFDEVEKANKSVFDLFLQILDEGRLTDNHGVRVSFANSINILTSNVGAKYFLDESLSFDEAKELALKDLWNPETDEFGNSKGFRPEFLNRFTGIFCFNRLGEAEIMMIAGKTMKELNSWIAENGVTVEMPEEDKKAMCAYKGEDGAEGGVYDPRNGARGIINFIERNITSDVADTLLMHPDTPGTVKVTYDAKTQTTKMDFVPKTDANQKKPAQAAKLAKG